MSNNLGRGIMGFYRAAMGSSGIVSISQLRAYVVLGVPDNGVSVRRTAAYAVLGFMQTGVTVSEHRASIVVGMQKPNLLGISEHKAYAIVYP